MPPFRTDLPAQSLRPTRGTLPAIIVLTTLLPGCQGLQVRDDGPVDGRPSEAAGLIDRYNANTAGIERLWARHAIAVEWVDEDGRRRTERGDGRLAIRKPRDVALEIGKTGTTAYWLGGNEQQFWWLDVNPHDDLPDRAYVGHYDDALAVADLPIPIPPDRLIALLGITALDVRAEEAKVERSAEGDDQNIRLRLPVVGAAEPLEQRIELETRTARPLAIAFVRPDGSTLAESRLSRHRPLPTPDQPLGAWSDVATRIEIDIPEHQARLVLHLDAPSLTSDAARFADAQFDLQTVLRAHRLSTDDVRLLGLR